MVYKNEIGSIQVVENKKFVSIISIPDILTLFIDLMESSTLAQD
jgi:hypothetical protein